MEFGVHFIDFLPGDPARLGPTLANAAKAAEQGGATVFTLADHFLQMENLGLQRRRRPGGWLAGRRRPRPGHRRSRAEDPFLEGYTSLGFLAAQTTTIDLTLLVTGVTYRYPGVLAKAVTTLDVLSQGRSMLGLGAAWYDREHAALGIPYPPLSARFEMLEETLQICLQMWSDNDGPYNGKHYQLAETICAPQPIRRPPILIGGDGEKKTLRPGGAVRRHLEQCGDRRRRAQAQDGRAEPPLRRGGPRSRRNPQDFWKVFWWSTHSRTPTST